MDLRRDARNNQEFLQKQTDWSKSPGGGGRRASHLVRVLSMLALGQTFVTTSDLFLGPSSLVPAVPLASWLISTAVPLQRVLEREPAVKSALALA